MGLPLPEIASWPSALISLYQVYYRINPWGDHRADLRNAQLLAQTANLYRDESKRKRPYEVIDFMPFLQKDETPQDNAANFRTAMRAAARKSKGKQ